MEKVLKKTVFTAAAVMFLVLACGSQPGPGEPGAVITVKERSVLGEDVTGSFERLRGDTVSVDVLRDNIVARELFLAHARELGYQNNREVQRLVHERRREILQSAWITHELEKVTLEDGTAREFWENLGTGVTYTAFSLKDSLLMDSLAALARSGEDVSRLAREFAMDAFTRGIEGKVSIPDVLYANLMDLDYLGEPATGDVIGPFTVPVGIRIIRIDSVWTYRPEPFEVDSSRIASMLLARHRETRKVFVEDSLKVAGGVFVNMDAVELMASRGNGPGFDAFSSEEETITAVTWDGGSRDIYSVSRNVNGLPHFLPRETNDPVWIAEYAERLAMFDIEMALGIEAGLDTVANAARQLSVKELEVLLDHYYEEIIQPRIQPDSALLEQVYVRLRETNPIQETRIFNVLFLANSEMKASAERIMQSGGDMLAAADEFEVFQPLLAEGEEYTTVPIARAVVPEGDRETLFGLDIGEEAVVSLNDTTALWFRLIQANPQRLPEFSEIRDRVVSAAGQEIEIEVIGGLVDSLEAVYHPYVDESFFKQFYIPAETDSVIGTGETGEVTDAL